MNTAGIIAKIADSENAITEIVTQDDRLTDEDRDRLTELRSERADLNTRLAAAAEVASKEVEKRTEAVEAVDARAPGLSVRYSQRPWRSVTLQARRRSCRRSLGSHQTRCHWRS